MVYVGIDVGGTTIKAGIVNEEGKILYKDVCHTAVENGQDAMVADMTELTLKVIKDAGYTADDIKAIGIGLPGIQDPRTGRVPFCTNLGWHDVDVVGMMQKKIDKPIYIGNDATVAGLAESVAGISAGVQNSVFVTLGTGVGGGVVLGGKVYSGSNGVGSEIGHIIVEYDGLPCTCGNLGCWERYASATALIRMGKEAAGKNPDGMIAKEVDGDLEKITAKVVLDSAKAGDPDAVKIFNDYIYYLCVGLVSIINMYDPEVIVLGGGVSHAGEFLLDAVRKKLPELVFYKTMPYARIELAVLGNDAGIIGAAMLGK